MFRVNFWKEPIRPLSTDVSNLLQIGVLPHLTTFLNSLLSCTCTRYHFHDFTTFLPPPPRPACVLTPLWRAMVPISSISLQQVWRAGPVSYKTGIFRVLWCQLYFIKAPGTVKFPQMHANPSGHLRNRNTMQCHFYAIWGVHESSLPVAHPGYQVFSDILFRLGLSANALTQCRIDVAVIITCFGTVWPFWCWCAVKLWYHHYHHIYAFLQQGRNEADRKKSETIFLCLHLKKPMHLQDT